MKVIQGPHARTRGTGTKPRPRERIEWHTYTALMATEPQCSFFIFVSPLPRFRQYLLKRNCAKRMKYEAYIPSAAVKFGM
mmetsp:Transcript_37250/g.51064  ORF Transcript_37250/g.51064 Transcript_37250/m.51064 type:complete len:80 (-) Transcript_37250:796-1035(-)